MVVGVAAAGGKERYTNRRRRSFYLQSEEEEEKVTTSRRRLKKSDSRVYERGTSCTFSRRLEIGFKARIYTRCIANTGLRCNRLVSILNLKLLQDLGIKKYDIYDPDRIANVLNSVDEMIYYYTNPKP